MEVIITQLNPEENIKPTYATADSSGFDLRMANSQPLILTPGARAIVATGVKVDLPVGMGLFLYARSGLACKHGIVLSNGVGVVDNDYVEEIKICLTNTSEVEYIIQPNERVAQAVLTPIFKAEFKWVEALDWSKSERGGFGSTGRG